MEIGNILRGESASFAVARSVQTAEEDVAAAGLPTADRMDLSRRWVEQMEEQRRTDACL